VQVEIYRLVIFAGMLSQNLAVAVDIGFKDIAAGAKLHKDNG
jgi:hypothetical protein